MAPVNVVRTLAEEEAWERAKLAARHQYPEASGERFYLRDAHLQENDRLSTEARASAPLAASRRP
jgi:hypothetical protein